MKSVSHCLFTGALLDTFFLDHLGEILFTASLIKVLMAPQFFVMVLSVNDVKQNKHYY